MKVIYDGGFTPTLAVEDDPKSGFFGWLFVRHPDGQWVSLAKVSEPFVAIERERCAQVVKHCSHEDGLGMGSHRIEAEIRRAPR